MNSLDNDLLAGNMPPQDISAEKAILGAVFLNPEALADVMEQVEPDDFYSRQHQILFQSMIELNDADQPIDVLTMKSSLETKNQLDDAGGVAYLAELANSVPSARNAAYYAKIVSAKSRLRQLIRTSTDIIALFVKFSAFNQMTSLHIACNAFFHKVTRHPEISSDRAQIACGIKRSRAGARGTVHLVFLKAFNKFTSIETRENPGPI